VSTNVPTSRFKTARAAISRTGSMGSLSVRHAAGAVGAPTSTQQRVRVRHLRGATGSSYLLNDGTVTSWRGDRLCHNATSPDRHHRAVGVTPCGVL
jgi:hypothetical protein